jgi:MoaE-MoaD fusion protein
MPDSVSRRSTAVTAGYATPVRVTVRLFAGLRERAGWSQKEVDAGNVSEVWSQLGLGDEPAGLLYAVNREYSPRDQALTDGDVVAVIPPVSGGAFLLSDLRVALDDVVREVASEEAGAIATFTGTARKHSRGRTVEYLDYEAYEGMAEDMMARLGDELKERYDIHEIAIHHRVGRVELGEPSVVIAVSSAHRADALSACKDAIDILKTNVPLWKKEVYEGGEEWIGKGS